LKNLNRHREVQMKSVRRSSRSSSRPFGAARLGALVLVMGAVFALAPVAAQAAPLTIEKFEGLTCTESNCNETTPAKFFKQAAGHPNFGITNTVLGAATFANEGGAKAIRTDLPPGQHTNPIATPMCPSALFGVTGPAPPECAEDTEVGFNEITLFNGVEFATFTGTVYNLNPPNGAPLQFGISVPLPGSFTGLPFTIFAKSFLEGGISWKFEPEAEGRFATGDQHEFFRLSGIDEPGAPFLVSSRLVVEGKAGVGLITNPSTCGQLYTTYLRVETHAGTAQHATSTTTVPQEGCNLVPFEPAFSLTPETAKSDEPDGVTTEVTVPQNTNPAGIESSNLKESVVNLPPGLTMNPSAANGLQGCTPAQFGLGVTENITCPSRSAIGTVAIESTSLPAESLRGRIFLGKPESGAITGPPYTVYVSAESPRFGVKSRVMGTVEPNPETGQIRAVFAQNPQEPFKSIKITFNGGAFAPLANPISCGAASTTASFTPFARPFEPVSPLVAAFTVAGCALPQFAAPPLSQSTSTEPPIGGAESNFTFTLTRPEGQQYLSQMSTLLPPGISAKIPSVTRCAEAQANAGTCSAASQVGTVQIKAGSGEPFPFSGKVYLTEKYEGAPYGLSIVVPTAAGPFNFGNVVSRAKITVNQSTAQVGVTVTKSFVPGHAGAVNGLPTIVQGIPTRIREITVNINRPNYLLNPTNCAPLKSESSLISTLGSKATTSSTLQVENCGALAFKPAFSASTNGKPTRANGASLGVNITQPVGGQANIMSVVTTLPKQLPSRLTTLQKACLLATFEADPSKCPKESNVGTATATTPTLPDKMSGPAYIVSRGAAFPDLELVLEGDGVRIILDGKTDIKNSITTSSFLANPDVPISSFGLNLPMGPFSLLAANGNFCLRPLKMPTTITGFNGKVLKQSTQLAVSNCLPITRHKVHGHEVTVSVHIPQGGRVRFSGFDLSIHTLFPKKSKTVTVKMFLTPSGLFQLRNKHRLNSEIRVGFIPRLKGGASFTSFAKVTFR
jgi:hypothetical protein